MGRLRRPTDRALAGKMVTSEKLLPGARVWRLAIAALPMAIALGFALAGWKSA